MTYRQIGVTTGGNVQEFIGTLAEQTDIPTDDLGPGSTYLDTTNKAGYIWDGDEWQSLV